ncbi:unnamed protein product, partial [Didymodactylos carnosus]
MTTQTVDKLIDSARELLEANEYLEARALYTQALALDPFDAKLWNYRSNAHMKLGYPELAFTDAARGLQLLDDSLARTTLSQNDHVLELGTMCVMKYPWDDFEPFSSEVDAETQLKEINIMFERFAPKLLIVR